MTARTQDNPRDEHIFEAGVSRLRHMIVHSVYSDRDVFLRELQRREKPGADRLARLFDRAHGR